VTHKARAIDPPVVSPTAGSGQFPGSIVDVGRNS
jgi:hypothetical protein